MAVKPWIVKGEFHLLAGDSQVGKTTLLLTLAAAFVGREAAV